MTAIDLHKIKAEHGGEVFEGGRRGIFPGPPPHSRRDRSLSVRIADDGRPLIYSFAGDDFRTCAAYLGLERPAPDGAGRQEREGRRQAREAEERARRETLAAFCESLWAGAGPVHGTPASYYLASRWLTEVPDGVRFHPRAPRGYSGRSTGPALLALAQSVTGAAKALQATFLTPDGRGKTGRITFGGLTGAAVRLAPVEPTLAVAEGLETAASFGALHSLPTWATLGTSNLEAFHPPSVVRHLVIAADGDPPGMKAARALAERLRSRCDVTIHPAPDGFDWNDVVTGRAPHG